MGVIVWSTLLGLSAIAGFWCARHLSGKAGIFWAGAIPWFGLLVCLLITEYVIPYQGGGASMWPIAQLFGGTIAAVTGIITYKLCKLKS